MKNQSKNNLIDGKYKFSDIVDIKQLTKIFDKFSKATGFTIGLIDNNSLELLVKTGWHDICVDFHRANEEACKVCKKSNKLLFSDLEQVRTVKIVECEHGLYDCATPIIIEGKHVANLATGQLLMREPDIKQFEKQAEIFGFNKNEYLKALKEVPVIDKKKVSEMMEYLSEFSIYIANEGLNKLRTNQLNEQLDKQNQEYATLNKEYKKSIEQLKKAKEKTEESEAHYARAIHGTNDGFWEWNIKTDETYLSPRWKELLGFEDDELIGHYDAFAKRIHPDDEARVQAAIQANLEQDIPYNAQIRMRTKSGTYRWFLAKGMAERNKNGEPTIMAGSITDITDIKKAEDDLAAEKDNLAVTLRSIGDGVITTDTKGKIVMLNRVAEALTEWTSKEATGLPLLDVFKIINQNNRQPCTNPVEKVLTTGDIVELANHTSLISRSGKEIIIADSAAPIHNKQSQTIGVVLVFRDMTEKHKLEESIQKTQKLESLGLLAGGIAHDFNNLLGGIFGYIEMAMNETEKTQVLNYLSESLNSMDRAKNLTQQLLTFSKGGKPIKKIERLFPFIQESVKFALSGTSVSSDFNVEDDLWLCKFDKNQISQVIENLTINAQQAMPNGGQIEITAENISFSENEHAELPAGKYVRLSIKDHGIGIPRTFLPRIFDPYYTTKSKGQGLGLASCYSIANRHEGCIDVESTPGQGSKFSLYLPACAEADKTITTNQGHNQHKGKGIFLVMDDEDANQQIMKIRLETFGYKVVLTKEGQEAVDYFKSAKQEGKNVSGMIFDLTVPGGMGGQEAIKKIREICKYTPAFVASGYSNDPVMAEPEKYGFNSSICKPFTSDELAVMLQKHLE